MSKNKPHSPDRRAECMRAIDTIKKLLGERLNYFNKVCKDEDDAELVLILKQLWDIADYIYYGKEIRRKK